MAKTEFEKLLKRICTRKVLDVNKISLLTATEREFMVKHIIRNRGPVVKELIPDGFDMSWLASMGYLHETKGRAFTFIHTSEHIIR